MGTAVKAGGSLVGLLAGALEKIDVEQAKLAITIAASSRKVDLRFTDPSFVGVGRTDALRKGLIIASLSKLLEEFTLFVRELFGQRNA